MIIIFILLILFAIVLLFKKEYDSFTNKNSSKNVVLIGDSILNNSAYVSQDESVPDLLSKKLLGNATVYNFAKDGATISDCYAQLDKIPFDSNATIFVSCGGNNILNSRNLNLNLNVTNLFAEYSQLLKSIKVRSPNASLYALNLYVPAGGHYKSYKPVIDQWNNLLDNNASVLGYSVLNINNLLVLEEDFVYGVEPSFKGGNKLVSELLDYTL